MIDLRLIEGVAYFKGKNITTEKHAHHALEYIFGIDRPFDLLSDTTTLKKVYGAVISPNYPHQFIGDNAIYLFIYLEPELLHVHQIKKYYDLNTHDLIPLNGLQAFPSPESVFDFSFFAERLDEPSVCSGVQHIDSRIEKSISLIKNSLSEGRIDSNTIAACVFLSPSRFSHLFKEQVGIPVRRFIRWCRIQAALRALLKGANLTESAHAAGFSDSAHFSRTFSKMFGVSPSSVLKK